MEIINLSKFSELAQGYFSFLIDDLGYHIIEDKDGGLYQEIRYEKDNQIVVLNYDMKGNTFHFDVRRKVNGAEPDYGDAINVIPFHNIILESDESVSYEDIQPKYPYFNDALKLNADLTKKYCTPILRGDIWPN